MKDRLLKIRMHTARNFGYTQDIDLANGLLDSIARIAKPKELSLHSNGRNPLDATPATTHSAGLGLHGGWER